MAMGFIMYSVAQMQHHTCSQFSQGNSIPSSRFGALQTTSAQNSNVQVVSTCPNVSTWV